MCRFVKKESFKFVSIMYSKWYMPASIIAKISVIGVFSLLFLLWIWGIVDLELNRTEENQTMAETTFR